MDAILQILIFGGAFFLMMKFGCGSHMLGHRSKFSQDGKTAPHGGGSCGGHKPESSAPEPGDPAGPPMRDTDPVCGKLVSTSSAKTSLHKGLIYFLCSSECRETFEANPEKYAVKEDETLPLQLEQG